MPNGSETATALVAEGRAVLSVGTAASTDQAVALFERALAVDPQCAPVYVGLAQAYLTRADDLRLGWHWLERAVAAGEQALALDPSAAEAYVTLGWVYRTQGALQKELALWQRRLQQVPGEPTALTRAGWILWFTGRPDDALPLLSAAAAQQPTDSWIPFFLGNAYLSLGDNDQALQQYERALALRPDHSSAFAGSMWSLLAAGRDQDARSRLQLLQASELDGDRYFVKAADLEYFLGDDASALPHARAAVAEDPEARYWPRGVCANTILAALLWQTDQQAAEESLRRSEQIDRERLAGGDEGYMPHFDLAAVYALQGDVAHAVDALHAAVAAGWRYRALAARDRVFRGIHANSAFQALITG